MQRPARQSYLQFLSTLSLRRATMHAAQAGNAEYNFYPRSPCGERRARVRARAAEGHFYPRSPCGERPHAQNHAPKTAKFLSTLSLRRATLKFLPFFLASSAFLSTLSLRRATELIGKQVKCCEISIHALLAESDNRRPNHVERHENFYPRSPCGERHTHPVTITVSIIFLSTLSLRRATTHHFPALHDIFISIHALLAESDLFLIIFPLS